MTASLRERLDLTIDYVLQQHVHPIEFIVLSLEVAEQLKKENSRMLSWPSELRPGRIGFYRGVELRLAANPLPRTEATEAEQTAEQNKQL